MQAGRQRSNRPFRAPPRIPPSHLLWRILRNRHPRNPPLTPLFPEPPEPRSRTFTLTQSQTMTHRNQTKVASMQTARGLDGVRSRFSIPVAGAFLGFALVFWLVPFFRAGWKGQAWAGVPDSFTYQETAEGLFAQRVTNWWDQHLEAQGLDGVRFEIPKRALFEMGALGFRTQFDRILMESNRSAVVKQVRRRLAEHVFGRLESAGRSADGPDAGAGSGSYGPPVKSLQLVRTLWPVGVNALANPAGEWNPPPVTEVTGAAHQVLGTYQLVAGQVVEIQDSGPPEGPQTPRLPIDPRVVNGTNPPGRPNPIVPGKPVASGRPAMGTTASRPPKMDPLVVPPHPPESMIHGPLPWRNGPPVRTPQPGEPAVKPPNAAGSNTPMPPGGVNGPGATRELPLLPPARSVPRPAPDPRPIPEPGTK